MGSPESSDQSAGNLGRAAVAGIDSRSGGVGGVDAHAATEMRRLHWADAWEVRLCLSTKADGQIVAHAETYRHGQYKCRIVLPGAVVDQPAALDALELKARDWIEDWQRREHSGNTGFADL